MNFSHMTAAACITFALVSSAKADPQSLQAEPAMQDSFDSQYIPGRVNPDFIRQRGRILGRQKDREMNSLHSPEMDAIGTGNVVISPGARVLGPIVNMPVIGGQERALRR